MDHLKSFVNSRLSSLTRSYDFQHVSRDVSPEHRADADNPETILIKRELGAAEDDWHERARDQLLEEILKDDLLMRLHDLMEREEIEKPAELAARLNTSVEEIKNAKKRFKCAWERVIAIVGPAPSTKEVAHG